MENLFNVGVRGMTICPIKAETSTAKPTYTAALDIGATNQISITKDTANATADGDDKQVANISMLTGGTLEWQGWGVPQATAEKLYGHTVNDDGELDESMGDLAPYVGVGFIRTLADKTNTWKYQAHWYYKAQAVEGNDEATTSGTNLSLNATTVTFNLVEPSFGPYHSSKTFDSETEATAWITAHIATT